MIKFTAHRDNGGTLVGLGLSAGNVARLREGKPIHVHLKEMNLPWNVELLIFFGETEEQMTKELKPYIDAATLVKPFTEKQ